MLLRARCIAQGAARWSGSLLRAGNVRNLLHISDRPVVDLSRLRVPSEWVPLAGHCHPDRPAVSRRPRPRFQPGLWDPKMCAGP
jgi:hypothetical protein